MTPAPSIQTRPSPDTIPSNWDAKRCGFVRKGAMTRHGRPGSRAKGIVVHPVLGGVIEDIAPHRTRLRKGDSLLALLSKGGAAQWGGHGARTKISVSLVRGFATLPGVHSSASRGLLPGCKSAA